MTSASIRRTQRPLAACAAAWAAVAAAAAPVVAPAVAPPAPVGGGGRGEDELALLQVRQDVSAAAQRAAPGQVAAGWTQVGGDINGEAAGDQSGYSLAMSADGATLAIGAYKNDGAAGIDSGHVRVYRLSAGTWIQIGGDIDGEAAGDYSGFPVAMSADGATLAIGARKNADAGRYAGHVRVYRQSGNSWSQVGGDIDGAAENDYSGHSLAMSDDGSTLAIGAIRNDDAGIDAGHVRVYRLSADTWTQVGGDIDGEAADDRSGQSVAMSADGSMVAIGANLNDDSGDNAGHVRVFRLSTDTWNQVGGGIGGEAARDESGHSLAMSADGATLAIGAIMNHARGPSTGHVRVYRLSADTWNQVGSDINGEARFDKFGSSLAMSADGSTLAIGAIYNDEAGNNAGHVQVYRLSGNTWTQVGGDINGENANDQSGKAVAMSDDGSMLAIGSPRVASDTGHVRVFFNQALTTSTTITTTTQAACTGESCSVYSDPHVSTFDALGRGVPDYLALIETGACSHRPVDVNAYETGDFWIVKAQDVQIQGRFVHSKEFVPDRAALGAVVVAGPALRGERLLLEPMNGRISWARRPLGDPARLDANQTGGLLELQSRPGPQPGSLRVEAALPRGMRLAAVRFSRHLDVKLTMPRALGARDGLCGNGNGVEDDDAEADVRARLGSLAVAPEELLFEGTQSF